VNIKKILTHCFLLIVFFASAQGYNRSREGKSQDICLYGGLSYYIGDLNQLGHFRYLDFAGGLGYRFNLDPRFALRGNIWLGKLRASDADDSSPVQRNRNLSFQSWIGEVSVQAEFNFLPFKIGTQDLFAPYIFLGVGAFRFNPYTTVGGRDYDLRPLSTEGQGTTYAPGVSRYSLTQFTIPFGLGFKWSVAKHLGIGVEWGMRKTFTDYIDDVSTTYPEPTALNSVIAMQLSNPTLNSDPTIDYAGRQRGDSKSTDWYNYTGVVISITLPQREPNCTGVGK
jgi:hypothetical protein